MSYGSCLYSKHWHGPCLESISSLRDHQNHILGLQHQNGLFQDFRQASNWADYYQSVGRNQTSQWYHQISNIVPPLWKLMATITA